MDLWEKYDTAISTWRPIFGKEQHIQARDLVGEINRQRRYYDGLVKERNQKTKEGKHLRRSSRLEGYVKEISSLMKRVLDLILV